MDQYKTSPKFVATFYDILGDLNHMLILNQSDDFFAKILITFFLAELIKIIAYIIFI